MRRNLKALRSPEFHRLGLGWDRADQAILLYQEFLIQFENKIFFTDPDIHRIVPVKFKSALSFKNNRAVIHVGGQLHNLICLAQRTLSLPDLAQVIAVGVLNQRDDLGCSVNGSVIFHHKKEKGAEAPLKLTALRAGFFIISKSGLHILAVHAGNVLN